MYQPIVNSESTHFSKSIFDSVHKRLDLGWNESDQAKLEYSLRFYTEYLQQFINSNTPIKSHILGSWSIALPICDTTNPDELFATLGDVEYEVEEHTNFWLTTHYPNPEPVVTLIPKFLPGQPTELLRLCDRIGSHLNCFVGGSDGAFLACISAGFSWAMHTDNDNDYELVSRRIHVPLQTSSECMMIWGDRDESGAEYCARAEHLEKHSVHIVRVDIPHTVVNMNANQYRTHLIIDINDE